MLWHPIIRRTIDISKQVHKILRVNYSQSLFEKPKDLDKIRNIGISAHIDAGKTTLTERILYYTGIIDEMHEVRGKDKVGATMDSMELERQRGITIQSAATQVSWKKHVFNIIDTPGHVDFTIEVERALRVLDGAILVLCAVAGVQCQTMTVHRQINRYKVPWLAFINKMDRSGADHLQVLTQLNTKLHEAAELVQLPIGTEKDFKGVVDLVEQKAYYFEGDNGEKVKVEDPPKGMAEEIKNYRTKLLDTLAFKDDEFLVQYAENGHIPTPEELKKIIRRTVLARKFIPIFLGTALKNKGVQPLLNGVVNYLPDPTEVKNYASIYSNDGSEPKKIELKTQREGVPPVVLAFKIETRQHGQVTYLRVYQGCLERGTTIYNTRTKRVARIIRLIRMHADKMMDIQAAYAGDICGMFGLECASGDTFVGSQDLLNLAMESIVVPEPVIYKSIKLLDNNRQNAFAKAMAKFTKEDPSFHMEWNTDSKETIISGMGELHLEIYAQRLEREYNCKVELGKPRVSFRESLINPVQFDYLHKKQHGGAGQYGRVIGILEPLPPEMNTQIVFQDETIGTNVPKKFVPAIEKGFRASCEKGSLSGNRISGVKFRLQDGDNHCVDSNDISFYLAAIGAMKQVFEYGKWQILEPIMKVLITVPHECHSGVMSVISKSHGRILGTQSLRDDIVVEAEIALNNMFNFSTELRSNTQGKGNYDMEYDHYRPANPVLQQQIIEEYNNLCNPQAAAEEKKRSKKKK